MFLFLFLFFCFFFLNFEQYASLSRDLNEFGCWQQHRGIPLNLIISGITSKGQRILYLKVLVPCSTCSSYLWFEVLFSINEHNWTVEFDPMNMSNINYSHSSKLYMQPLWFGPKLHHVLESLLTWIHSLKHKIIQVSARFANNKLC